MSGIVDLWTSELAKLRNKGQADSSSSSAPTSHEAATEPVVAHGGSVSWLNSLAQAIQVIKKLPALHCSEDSVSMLVDSFSA